MTGISSNNFGSFPTWDDFMNGQRINRGFGFGAANNSFNTLSSWDPFATSPFAQNFAPTNFVFSPFTSSGSSSTGSDSVSSREDMRKKIQQEREQRVQNAAFLLEKNKQIQQAQELINISEQRIKTVKNGKKINGNTVVDKSALTDPVRKEDGTIDTAATAEAAKPQKKTIGQKLWSWVASAGEVVTNMGKAIIAWDDKQGKINKKQALINGLTVAASIGSWFIPVIGPAIGTGLLYAGGAAGAIGLGKGIVDYAKADENDEEALEKARQNTISGGITTILSLLGLRGLGQSANAAGQAANISSKTSLLGKTAESTVKFGKDITVNALKATKQAIDADRALIASQTGNGLTRFAKATASKTVSGFKNYDSWENRYNSQYDKMETSLNNRLTEINNKLITERNAAKRALLQEQKTMIESNLNELRGLSRVQTKTDFDNLKTTNSSTQNTEKLTSYTHNASGGYEIGGQQIAAKRFSEFQKEMKLIEKQYNKQLKQLINTKEKVMRTYARKPDMHMSELDTYTQRTLRIKYNTPDKQKAGIEALSKQLTDIEIKIADKTQQIARTTKPRTLRRLKQDLKNLNDSKTNIQNELSICSSVKFSHWYKPSTWRKNEYELAIGGENAGLGLLFKQTGSAMTTPTAVTVFGLGHLEKGFSIPELSIDLAQLTPEQTEEILIQLEKDKSQYEEVKKQLESINTAEEWQAIQSKMEAQAQAQAQAQSQQQEKTQAEQEK